MIKPSLSSLCHLIAAILLVSFFSGEAAARSGGGWKLPIFEAPGPQVIAAATDLTRSEKGKGVILLDERLVTFEKDGRCTYRSRLVYRILTQAGVKEWSTMQTNWVSWYQEHPVFRARVVTPDGAEYHLSPETISDASVGSTTELFTDRKMVRAPLPAVTAGAVVEREIVVKEKAIPFAGGADHHFAYPRGVKILKSRVVIDYPRELNLRHALRLLPDVDPVIREENGRKRIVLEFGPLGPLPATEQGVPGDLPGSPEVAITTAQSWAALGAGYGEMVDRQIAGAELSALVKEVVGESTSREVTVKKLLARLQKDIRYTGLEFGSSSIVPHTPQETMERRYGDCKDQAALLVKMLRSAGVPAYVALLRAGEGRDVDPDFPEMSLFNHVIVYVPGTPALWVDPTDPFTPAGELPIVDQGRYALIIDGATTSLSLTPEAPSTANTQVETRQFLLAEEGAAQLSVSVKTSGAIAAQYRRTFYGKDRETVRKELEKYASSAYLTKKLYDVKFPDPKEVSVPFSVSFASNEAKRGFTEGRQAVLALSPAALTTHLPAPLTGEGKGQSPGIRKQDYILPVPHVMEVRCQIVPPAGFKVQALPESRKSRIGPMAIEREFHVEADGVVTALLRLDTGKRRLTPEEFKEIKDGVKLLRAEKPTVVRFDFVPISLLEAGKVREALAELRRLAASHPKEVLHHVRLAEALVRVGLVSAARKEAQRAIELNPDSFLAHRTYALTLQHDLTGRLQHRGFDREGALAEYRKAKALNPKDLGTRADLAVLLQFDDQGVRYSRQADLAGAIREYQAIRSELNSKKYDRNLLSCLLRTQQWKEMKTLALSLEPSEEANVYLLTAIAAEDGTDGAITEAKDRLGEAAPRQRALEEAGYQLVKVRRYQDAASLFDEASKGRENAASLRAKAKEIRKFQPFEKVIESDKGPTSVIKKMLLFLYAPEFAGRYADDLLALYAPAIREEAEKEGTAKDAREELAQLRAKVKDADALPPEVTADIVISSTEYKVEGGDGGCYRITAIVTRPPEVRSYRFLVVKDDDGYYLLNRAASSNVAGLEILRQLESGNLVAAKTLLDWLREDIRHDNGDDPLAENPFLLLWPRGSAAEAAGMRLAAAALLSDSRSARAIPLLKEAKASATGERLRGIDIALMKVLVANKRYTELVNLCDGLGPRYPLSGQLFALRSLSLKMLHRYDEAKKGAEERLRKLPKDPIAPRVLADCETEQGRFQESRKWLKMIDAAGVANRADYNLLAWLGLFDTADPGESIGYAERAVSLSGGKESAVLHTLAALYAETGKTAEAREMITRAIAGNAQENPLPHDWYVLGRIAEEYGEMESAKEAYSKVAGPEGDSSPAASAYALVRKRLDKGEKQLM